MTTKQAVAALAGRSQRAKAWSLLPALIALALCGGAPAKADPVEDFYKGRNVQIVIGYSDGGGYDLYARVLARYMSKYIPGKPTLIPQNLPGAGSLKAANYLYNAAPKDGSVFGIIGRGLPMEPLLGEAQYDATKFAWIGSITNEISICASWGASPIKTWDDAYKTEFAVGGNGSGSDPDIFALLLRNVFGAKIKLVTGYPGGADINLAMERGELHGRCGWSWSSIKSRNASWVKEKKINLLLQFALEKSPELPDVPLVMDLAKTEEQRQILRLVLSRQVMGRPILAPPGIPEDRKQALRKAFDATMKDPEFIAEAEKADLEVNPVTGAEIDTLLGEVYRTPKGVVEKTAHAIK
jgi:tripartite-type tricarboxylate transporter receptor subunit TctC